MRNFPVIENYDMGSDIVLGSYVGREKADISELDDLIELIGSKNIIKVSNIFRRLHYWRIR